MKQVVGVGKRQHACPAGCRMVKITDTLWLCPHKAWGWSTNLIGAEAEARDLMERAGGYDAMLKRQNAKRQDASNVVSKSEMPGAQP